MAEETKTQTTETTQPAAPQAELTVNDLNALKQIIDVASTRGAFRANEMSVVGATYNKLEAFLNAVVQAQQPKEEAKGE